MTKTMGTKIYNLGNEVSTSDLKDLEEKFEKFGFTDFKWINPKEIIVSQWVRLKCMFGCSSYGKKATCPPNSPSISECQQFFNDYSVGVIFHFQKKFKKPEDRFPWIKDANLNLYNLERDVFLSGHHKAFLLFMGPCSLCEECSGNKEECENPLLARPTPEALGIDVYSTARRHGYPIKVLSDYLDTMNRYAILLVK